MKEKIAEDEYLNNILIKGEISNFKNHYTGHLYFTLKDENSRIMAVMFRNNAMKIKFNPTDGTKVLVIGRINVYEANGNYQIYVEEMMEDGIGNLALEFEKLKKKFRHDELVTVLFEPSEAYPLLNDKTTFYVCRNFSCRPPVNEL